ncbi:hypothetical protein DNH61_18665 [Paenibacillus sambharensis]|uniref:Polyprenyl synthetase n=1 Tax=Paenibacillus sambharensis TaxID=1803190 RepID=A0A2W1L650_9BACL|nr:hypothetical protein [Paenibacillus sambharensis]PZD94423.1 hypothetical protein DNH61_18665 [Paenibacillus sambharensis]
MEWLNNYEEDLRRVFARVKDVAAGFPAPLDRESLSYLSHFDPCLEHSSKNYICYLLPFWLMGQADVKPTVCRDLAAANVMAMLHFFIIDDAMDTDDGRRWLYLPAGQLFYEAFQDCYRQHFPAASPLWELYKNYIRDWAEQVVSERINGTSPGDWAAIARKAGPLKLSSSAVLLLSGAGDRIPDISEAVDLVLTTLQLADDWADWKDDLNVEGNNALLALIREKLQLGKDERLTAEAVKQAVYVDKALADYVSLANLNRERLAQIENAPVHLTAFHDYICNRLEEDAKQIESSRMMLEQGGLSYWLSKLVK